jgi:transposase
MRQAARHGTITSRDHRQQLDALDPAATAPGAAVADGRDGAARADRAASEREVAFKQALIDKLTHENAMLKRLKFAATSERFASTRPSRRACWKRRWTATWPSWTAEIEREREQAGDKDKTEKKTPKRAPLPPHLPRRDVHHEPENTCLRLRQPDAAHRPGRGREAGLPARRVHRRAPCARQVGVPLLREADRPGAGAGARHRQGHPHGRPAGAGAGGQVPGPPAAVPPGAIFERAGHLIARSTLAQWVGECGAQLQPLVQALADELRRHAVLHADETPVAMLKPKHLRDGKTHKAYIWSYCTTSANPTRRWCSSSPRPAAARTCASSCGWTRPTAWQGTLVTDGFSGYKATLRAWA